MTSVASQTEKSRVRGLDAARVIASLATVLYHAAISPEAVRARECLRFAVSYFGIVSAFFLVSSLRRNSDRTYGAFAPGRFKRLYLPFLGWSAVYLGLSEVQHRFLAHDGNAHIDWDLLVGGSNYVLWFLPYLLVATLLAFPVVRFSVRSRRREVAVAAVLAGVGIAMSLFPLAGDATGFLASREWWISRFESDPTTAGNLAFAASKWWARGPSYLWGLAIAMAWRPRTGVARVSGLVSLAGLGIMIVCGAAATMVGTVGVADNGMPIVVGHMNVLDNVMGVGLFMIALGPTPLQNPGGLARFGMLTYGIYLSHQILVLVLQTVLHKKGIEPHWWNDLVVFAISVGAAAVVTIALRRIRWTRWLVP